MTGVTVNEQTVFRRRYRRCIKMEEE